MSKMEHPRHVVFKTFSGLLLAGILAIGILVYSQPSSPPHTVSVLYLTEDPGEYGNFQVFEATAYCLNGTTFSGVRVNRGIVAADPDVLPIGSVIEVEAGDYSGIYTVLDTGAAIQGPIIDIYMPDYEEAIQFGRREVRIRVLRFGWEHTLSVEYASVVTAG